MNPRSHTLIIGAFLCAVGLIGGLVGCSSGTTSSPGPTAPPTQTLTPRPTPTAAATLTRTEEIAQEFISQGLVTSRQRCPAIMGPEYTCSVLNGVERISRPEWGELLPKTEFYLVKYEFEAQDFRSMPGILIVEQNEQRYTSETCDLLLKVNDIVVTDDNRELIARAWALTTIPGYLGEEVTFTKWEKVSYTAEQAGYPYNYNLQGWTRLGGWEVGWWFVFGGDRLEVASGPSVGESEIGNYVEQPASDLTTWSIRFYDSFQDCFFAGG